MKFLPAEYAFNDVNKKKKYLKLEGVFTLRTANMFDVMTMGWINQVLVSSCTQLYPQLKSPWLSCDFQCSKISKNSLINNFTLWMFPRLAGQFIPNLNELFTTRHSRKVVDYLKREMFLLLNAITYKTFFPSNFLCDNERARSLWRLMNINNNCSSQRFQHNLDHRFHHRTDEHVDLDRKLLRVQFY